MWFLSCCEWPVDVTPFMECLLGYGLMLKVNVD